MWSILPRPLLLAPVLSDISQTLNNIYNNLFLPALGGAVVIMLAYGGFLWMTSAGSEDVRRQTLGKRVIIGTIVGGAIVFLAGQLGKALLNNFQ